MREVTPIWNNYQKLRDEVISCLTSELPVERIKAAFQGQIESRRRFERIQTVPELIMELEHQLVIFPEKRGIAYLVFIMESVGAVSGFSLPSPLQGRLQSMSTQLTPVQGQDRRQDFRGGGRPARLSSHLMVKLGRDLKEAQGRDWEHFVLGLGLHMVEREVVRLTQGEVDNLYKQEGGNIVLVIEAALRMFESRCEAAAVRQDLGLHIAFLLESEDVFEPPLRRLAREIREVRERELKNAAAGC